MESTKDMTLHLQRQAHPERHAGRQAVLQRQREHGGDPKLDHEGACRRSLVASGGETKIEGVTLKMAGKTQAELAAAMIKVAAQGKLGLESSGMADLKGAMTTVGGRS